MRHLQARLLFGLTTVLATVCLLGPVAIYAANTTTTRSQNGVRLVGGSATRGRLEISSRAWWLVGDDGAAVWRPVCEEGGLVDDDMARIMCVMLGFQFGRRYYKPTINHRKPNASLPYSYDPVGYLYCQPNPNSSGSNTSPAQNGTAATGNAVPHHRLLIDKAMRVSKRGSASTRVHTGATSSVASHSAQSVHGKQHGRHHHGEQQQQYQAPNKSHYQQLGAARETLTRGSSSRSLLAPLTGALDTPPDAPYTCSFRLGDCPYSGPLVGIQCSHVHMPPAPPPPPSPPNPPPAPPPGSQSIRLYGGGYNTRQPESNLCPSADYCRVYGRVELQVDVPNGGGGGKVWAPLCSTAPRLTFSVGQMACWQAFDWPRFAYRPNFTVTGESPKHPFTIPSGLVTAPGTFDPAKYSAWVTVKGGRFSKATRLQDLDLQVTSTPCGSGALFAVVCRIAAR